MTTGAIRQPEQARSRALVESVLVATKKLIAASGVNPVTMTDIAQQAGVTSRAIYRYFPNRAAIIRHIAIETFSENASLFAQPNDGNLAQRVETAVRDYVQIHQDEPWRLPLRNAILADPDLMALDAEDSRLNAARIADDLQQHSPHSRARLERRALLVIESLDGLIRLLTVEPADEGEALIDEFVQSALVSLVGPS